MAKETKKPGPGTGIPEVPNKPHNELHNELEAIRDRDPLQEGVLGFVEILEANKAIVAGVIAALLLGGIGYVSWDMLKQRSERKAQEALYNVEKPFSDKRDKFQQAKFAALSGQKVEELIKAGTAERASGDLSKDYGTLVDDLEAFAVKNPGTAAAAQAALMSAETRVEYKQPEKALSTLEATVKSTKAKTVLGGLTRIATGNAQAALGKCDQALKNWEEVLAAKEIAFLHSEAALRAGLCLEKSGDKPKAIEMYRKASSESDKSSSAQTARTLLRALELGT